MIYLCVVTMLCTTVYAQEQSSDTFEHQVSDLLTPVKSLKNKELFSEELSKVFIYNINAKQLKQLYTKNYKSFSWSLETAHGVQQLELKQIDLLAPTYILSTSSDNLPKDISLGKFYHGTLQSDNQSLVAVSVYEDDLKVLISNIHGDFEIHRQESNKFIGYYNNDVLKKRESFCSTSDEGVEVEIIEGKQEKSAAGSCVEIYIECDYESFKDNGSTVSKTQNWATSLFNEVKLLYQNEGITLKLSQVKVWNTPDPYRTHNNVTGMLGAFASNVKNNYNGRLAQLLTTRVSGGIAWVNMLCNNYNTGGNFGPYSVCGGMNTSKIKVPNYSWNVHVMAHELGHSFGSPHSHACKWGPGKNTALDNCQSTEGSCGAGPTPSGGGTIMSYCHLSGPGVSFSKGFGTEPGNLIRSKMNTSSCVTGCATTTNLDNDNCSGAIELAVTASCSAKTYSNVGATTSGATPTFACGNTGSTKDVWFKVKVPSSGKVNIETSQISNGLTDMIMQVYSGSCGSLTRVTCQDDDIVRHAKAVLTGRTPNETLYIRIVEYKSDNFGSFGICAYGSGTLGGGDNCTTVGDICNDGDACTTNDRIKADCSCEGTMADSDGDGVCNADDKCNGGDDNLDTDRDGIPNHCDSCNNSLIGQACNDNNDCTTNDRYDANCNCIGTTIDSDRDGVCDQEDKCPGGNDKADSDRDGIPDHCDTCDGGLVGSICNDGNACTTNDRYDSSCNCVGTMKDTDRDGVCDAQDKCPGGNDSLDSDRDGIPNHCDTCDGRLAGSVCNDGNACTTNDRYDSSCNCIGTMTDSDRDGVCDAEDKCPGGNDSLDSDRDGIPDHCDSCDGRLAGTTCNDGNACTSNDRYDSNCNCEGTLLDADGDGVCDRDDICPGGNDNIDTDRDGIPNHCDECNESLVGQRCNDGNACTSNDRYNTSCDCVGVLLDADGDGVCDRDDKCPGGDDRLDADFDGVPDLCDDCDRSKVGAPCNDRDACTIRDKYDANCNCLGIFVDSDRDGVCDAEDICPDGDDNLDSDGDGLPDACESCNVDSDGDGVCDTDDICPGGDDLQDEDNNGQPDFCQACDEEHVDLSGSLTTNSAVGATKTIETNSRIKTNVSLTIVAGESMSFEPGFEVESQGILTAIIDACADYFDFKEEHIEEKN